MAPSQILIKFFGCSMNSYKHQYTRSGDFKRQITSTLAALFFKLPAQFQEVNRINTERQGLVMRNATILLSDSKILSFCLLLFHVHHFLAKY